MRQHYTVLLAITLLAATENFSGSPMRQLAFAQSSPSSTEVARGFQVVPADHPAYQVLRDFSKKNRMQGIPPETDPFNNRTVTRLEMASLFSRVLSYLEDVAETKAKPEEALKAPLSSADLQNVQKLTAEFLPELRAIGFDFQRLRTDLPIIFKLSDPTLSPDKRGGDIQSLVDILIDGARAGDENSVLKRLEGRISGYFQFRQDALMGDRRMFNGAGAGGTGQRPSTNAPAIGGPSSAFLVRRGRLKFSDRFTPKDEFVFQLDMPTNSTVNIRDAFVRSLNFPAKGFALRAGQYAFVYGFEYLYSSRYRETPERSLGYSDSSQASLIYKQSVSTTGGVVTPGSVVPFFRDQDRDIGVELSWAQTRKTTVTPRAAFSIIQGEGRGIEGQRGLNSVYDLVMSAEAIYSGPKKDSLQGGLSYYKGALPVRRGSPVDNQPTDFVNANRSFGGIYLRYITPRASEYRVEYSGGKYEVTPDRAQLLEGNTFNAWYVVTRQPVAKNLEAYLKYDEFNPVKSSTIVAGVKGSDLSRKTLSLGLLYQLTPATRFRMNYSQGLTPFDPSRPAGDVLRKKVGLLQTEIQMAY